MALSPESNPFVGLRSYESHESILFFGRQDQTIELLQKLHLFRFLAVIGSSGSGKSSLVKAGLIPRLKAGYLVKNQSSWVIVTMKPGKDALLNLAEALLSLFNESNNGFTAADLKKRILEQGFEAIPDIWSPQKLGKANYFLLVDQFEELFRIALNTSEIAKRDEAADFVNVLLHLSHQKIISFYITITMRSDFIGDCAQFYGLPEAINKGLYLVPRLSRIQLEIVVEGPVRLYNQKISPALTTTLLNDAQMIEDALPLLQHVLMRTWNYEMNTDKNGELDVMDYYNVGRIENALSLHADEVLLGMTTEERKVTEKMFQALTAIDQNGRKIRRPALLSELVLITKTNKEVLQKIINRFTGNTSFLITSKVEDRDDLLIDISHESLIRQWQRLNDWVDTEADSARIFLRLVEAEKLYKEKNKNLLSGNELHQFWHWYTTFNPSPEWARRYSESCNDCINYLKKSRSVNLRNKILLFGAITSVVLVICIFSIKVYSDYVASTNQLALSYWTSSQNLADKNNFFDALHLIAEAEETSRRDDIIKDLLINGESFLPAACLKNMFPVNAIINSAVFSPDGKLIIIAVQNGVVSVIDKTTGKKVEEFISDSLPVVSAVFSPDQNSILTAGHDSTARLWDVKNGLQIKAFKHPQAVTGASFSADGHFVVTACADSCARIWNVAAENQVDTFRQDATVYSAVLSQDNKRLLTSGSDSTAHLWNVVTGKPVYSLRHNTPYVNSAVFSADEKRILTTGNDSTARIWDAATGMPIDSFYHESEVTNGAFSPDGKWIATCTRDKYVHIWNIESPNSKSFILKHAGAVYSVNFSKDGKWLLTGGKDTIVRLWNMEAATINAINTFQTRGIVNNAGFSNDGKFILTCGSDSLARVWNIANSQLINSFNNGSVINKGVFSNDGKYVLTCGSDSTARLWNISSGKLQNHFKHNGIVRSAVFNADGKTILTTGDDSTIRFWTIQAKPGRIIKFKDKVRSGVLSPDGASLLIIGADSTAYLLSSKTGKRLKSFRQEDVIKSAVFSPDGKWALTAGWDNTARMWSIATGEQNGSSMRHSKYIMEAVFSPDGKWILTAGWDSCVRIWEITTKNQIIALLQKSPVNSVVFSPDQTSILTANRDSNAMLSRIPGDLDIPKALFKLQVQVLTGARYNIKTNETECLSPEQWQSLNRDYEREAKEHYKACKYQQYNVWRRFNPNEASKIHPSTKE
ncbi:WD40 repeat domain-containing protein [Ilyomonas limi]|uniref:WD40 repeat domain-containing protein n=1 Tax=Ilyomonas limi TaxID=2575867 RepID=A0A4V5UV56_9BACT|nr:WD40 repeat domain-containing protein [Ilyomonas limi]TKK71763.1 WD40 repeat domain-containing protein [Ilyomonas limi]